MNAHLVISAASADQFPRSGLPEVAMVGRSNVGKSSLINALVKQKIARTSAAPGKTRLANYYLIDSKLYLVDLPGYGYARGGDASVKAFEQLTRDYFDVADSSAIEGVLQLIDSRHPDLASDMTAFKWLVARQLPPVIVATKIDKLGRSEQTRVVDRLERKYGARVLPVSATRSTGLKAVWDVIGAWARKG